MFLYEEYQLRRGPREPPMIVSHFKWQYSSDIHAPTIFKTTGGCKNFLSRNIFILHVLTTFYILSLALQNEKRPYSYKFKYILSYSTLQEQQQQ